jgi:hypothetical protein
LGNERIDFMSTPNRKENPFRLVSTEKRPEETKNSDQSILPSLLAAFKAANADSYVLQTDNGTYHVHIPDIPVVHQGQSTNDDIERQANTLYSSMSGNYPSLIANQIASPFYEQAAAEQEKDGGHMDEGTKYLLDRLDKDFRDHKREVAERDARLQSEMQEREQRIHQEAKEREERILSAIQESSRRMDNQLAEIKQSVNQAETRIAETTKLANETAKHVQTMVTTNLWGTVATIIGIIGLGIAIWSAVKSAAPTTPPNQVPSPPAATQNHTS